MYVLSILSKMIFKTTLAHISLQDNEMILVMLYKIYVLNHILNNQEFSEVSYRTYIMHQIGHNR